jgi:hypothetical protein
MVDMINSLRGPARAVSDTEARPPTQAAAPAATAPTYRPLTDADRHAYAQRRKRIFDELVPDYNDAQRAQLHDSLAIDTSHKVGGTGVKFDVEGEYTKKSGEKKKARFTFEPRLNEADIRFELDHVWATLLPKAGQPTVPLWLESVGAVAPDTGYYHGYAKAHLKGGVGTAPDELGRKPEDWSMDVRNDVAAIGIFGEFTGQGDRKLLQLKLHNLSDGTMAAVQCDGNTTLTDYPNQHPFDRFKNWIVGGAFSVPSAQDLLFQAYVEGKADFDLNVMRDAAERISQLSDQDIRDALQPLIAQTFGKGKPVKGYANAEALVQGMLAKRNGIVAETEQLITALETDRARFTDGKVPLHERLMDKKVDAGGIWQTSPLFALVNEHSQHAHQARARKQGLPTFTTA